MEQMTLFEGSHRWTVTTITRYLRQVLEADGSLKDIWVQGEISNLSRPSSGHIYFTLKDPAAALRCVMWKGEAGRLRFNLQDGMAVEAYGSIGVYETAGQYQLYTGVLRPVGEGALYQEYLRLKALLQAEGLFDLGRKRGIPEFPRTIGIVTSPTGAALQDMLNVLKRRLPMLEVVVVPTPVQGDAAPAGIIAALESLNHLIGIDLILLARGGGSIEDLWAFNEERVVRAIYNSVVPIITGVGHETDFTLADFAADLRAATPTAAAELATPVTSLDLTTNLINQVRIQKKAITAILVRKHEVGGWLENRLNLFIPIRRVNKEQQRLDDVSHRLNAAGIHHIELLEVYLNGLANRLISLSPQAVLRRGFAVIKKGSTVIYSPTQVGPGDILQMRVRDGEFCAQVKEKG